MALLNFRNNRSNNKLTKAEKRQQRLDKLMKTLDQSMSAFDEQQRSADDVIDGVWQDAIGRLTTDNRTALSSLTGRGAFMALLDTQMQIQEAIGTKEAVKKYRDLAEDFENNDYSVSELEMLAGAAMTEMTTHSLIFASIKKSGVEKIMTQGDNLAQKAQNSDAVTTATLSLAKALIQNPSLQMKKMQDGFRVTKYEESETLEIILGEINVAYIETTAIAPGKMQDRAKTVRQSPKYNL